MLPLVHLSGILLALDAIWQKRSSQGATAWAIGLLAFPYLGIPFYLIFGRSRFQGYVSARKSQDAKLRSIADNLLLNAKSPDRLPAAHVERPAFSVLEKLARMPFTTGHTAALLVDGEATFAAIFMAIKNAKQYVFVQFYIVRNDDLGRQLAHVLKEKAAQGVAVCFLYDEVGSHKTATPYWKDLKAAGVKVAPFNSRGGGWRNRFQINFRNHRKIVVVDGIKAFVGGHNVGEEYLGRGPLGPWRDTHVEVTGPMVAAIQLSFIEDWHWARGEVLMFKEDALPLVPLLSPPSAGEQLIGLALPTGPADEVPVCSLMFSQMIQSARHRLWISSPYFVPDSQIMSQLKLAALRGVDVRIVIPARPDHLLTHWASFAFIETMEPFGVRFYRLESAFPHQKVVLVDNDGVAIGTANLDNRSLYLNFEITLLFVGSSLGKSVATMLEADMAHAAVVKAGALEAKPFLFRLGVRLARLFAPIL